MSVAFGGEQVFLTFVGAGYGHWGLWHVVSPSLCVTSDLGSILPWCWL